MKCVDARWTPSEVQFPVSPVGLRSYTRQAGAFIGATGKVHPSACDREPFLQGRSEGEGVQEENIGQGTLRRAEMMEGVWKDETNDVGGAGGGRCVGGTRCLGSRHRKSEYVKEGRWDIRGEKLIRVGYDRLNLLLVLPFCLKRICNCSAAWVLPITPTLNQQNFKSWRNVDLRGVTFGLGAEAAGELGERISVDCSRVWVPNYSNEWISELQWNVICNTGEWMNFLKNIP